MKWSQALGVVLVTASVGCSTTSGPDVPVEPTFAASAPVVVGDSLRVSAVVANPIGREITIILRIPCTSTLRVFRAGVTAPAWDQLQWLNARPGGCKWLEKPTTLGPLEQRTLTATAAVSDILGDSLAGGTFSVSVAIAYGAAPVTIREVAAPGTVLLSKP